MNTALSGPKCRQKGAHLGAGDLDAGDVGVVFGLLDASSKRFDLLVERRVQGADDLKVHGLEAVQRGVLEDALPPDVHRENLAVGIEEGFRLDDHDF